MAVSACSARGARGSPPCDRALRARRRRPVPEPQRSAAAHTPQAKAGALWWTHGPRMLPIVTSNDGDRRERLPSLSEGEPRPIAEGEVKSPPRGEDVRVRCCDNADHGVNQEAQAQRIRQDGGGAYLAGGRAPRRAARGAARRAASQVRPARSAQHAARTAAACEAAVVPASKEGPSAPPSPKARKGGGQATVT